MGAAPGHLEIARAEGAVYVRVVGAGSFAVALPLRETGEELIAEGHRKFLIDLRACESVDSTFMGTLAGLAASVGMGAGAEGGWIQAVNANPHVLRLMHELGLAKILRVRTDAVEVPALPGTRLEARLGGPAKRLETAADAHRRLLPLDPANEKRFAGVLQLLDKELQGLRARGHA